MRLYKITQKKRFDNSFHYTVATAIWITSVPADDGVTVDQTESKNAALMVQTTYR